MKVAVIIASNGMVSNELLKVAIYTAGNISNVSSIGFYEGESVEILIERYKKTLENLNIQHGVLFLIDSMNSTHQLVASYFSLQHPESEIVSGINLPMLLALFISEANETCPYILARKAQEYGTHAICILQNIKSSV